VSCERRLLLFALPCVLFGCAGGCGRAFQATMQPSSPVPERYTVVIEQLTIHSDFQLAAHHRLLDELKGLRSPLLSKLELPGSDEPIHVYLFETQERFQEFVGRDYPQLPARRAFFMETDTRLAVYSHWGDRIAEDLRHEVAHGYLHSVVPRLPLWLDEGLAEYFEVPLGHEGLNRDHVVWLAEQRRAGQWKPRLEHLEGLSSISEMEFTDYAEAWAWVHFLLETEPGRRSLMVDYLHRLRTEGAAPPLSTSLRQWFPRAEEALLAHLVSLDHRDVATDP